ncbi:MAG TPA: TaqI-like C-terminal specificity domain-containing protein [Candidatus Acidoferrales bacterium]|nr:TaqI-like C-terminal specificity domain-containing protein [Candidatus Acidoferrales bacterium]
MNRDQARTLIAQTFTQSFDKPRFGSFVVNVLNRIDESKAGSWNSQYIKDAFKDHVQRYERLGTYTSAENEKLDVLIVYLTTASKLERARTAIRNFVADHLKTRDEKDAALVAFVSPTEKQWRFSYVKMDYASVASESGKVGVETRLTPARRFSYLVGEGESCHTAQTRFLALLQDTGTNPTFADIEEAFSVEAVTKEFFTKYAQLFGEIHKALEVLIEKDKAIRQEFNKKRINIIDFAKKLMGQIVFLYFLQKKGWLGVPKGEDWGAGPHDFLRQLAAAQKGKYDNFFNDVLEPLFYDTLATDRGHAAWCDRFQCRIPFLNGGLFEPLGDYDWRKIDIPLPNSLFTNTKQFEGDILGTGVLDIFDRYNFTVNEAEPLEKEVAIDPEMLGKVFENLIEENRRKGLGAYYTPREIVHYMCQESLVNYLDTALNANKQLVSRDDIETFVHLGEQISHYEAVEAKYAIKMPKSIQQQARLLDESLAAITVCDPAVGSGAFPVGMMTEIVRARCALTSYFNDVHERTPYYFKRHAIQNSLYGVDIDPGAIEIAKLRLWLSLVVDEEETTQIKPLPNLDYKVVVGNSLFGIEKTLFNEKLFHRLEELKPLYFDESDRGQKERYKKEIDDLIHTLTNGKEAFDFEIYFSEVFHNKKGFAVVIANPPYIFARESAKKGFTDEDKKYFYKNYELAEYQLNLYPLFVEKGARLLRPTGSLCFITPNNWLTINTNKTMRKFVLGQSDVSIVNFYARVFESADVDSSILIFTKSAHNHRVRLFEYTDDFRFIKEADSEFFLKQREYVINIEAFKSGGTASLMQKIEAHSAPLSGVADVRAGLKAYETGCGVPPQTNQMKKERVYHNTRKISKDYIKYFDGKDVCRYYLGWSGEYLKYGDNLAAPRKDFRLYSTARILVRQIPAKPPYCVHACLTDEVALNDLNSMNIINIREKPEYVLGVLNSRMVSWWFVHKFGKMQRETFPQFKVNELADFPLPSNGHKHRDEIAKLVAQVLEAKRGNHAADTTALEKEIDRLVYDLYVLTPEERAIIEASVEPRTARNSKTTAAEPATKAPARN